MLKIAERITVLNCAAQAAQARGSKELSTFHKHTAQTLEAITVQYHRLAAAAQDTVRRSNGQDPAMNILARELKAQTTPGMKSDWGHVGLDWRGQ